MDAEITASDGGFYNCLEQLPGAAEKANFSKMVELRSLVTELKAAARDRNILTHSVWLEVQGKIVIQNFPDYTEVNGCSLKGMVNDSLRSAHENGRSKSYKPLPPICTISERLTNLFQN
jgi:hypothetical protein